jgi:hypothetical protein
MDKIEATRLRMREAGVEYERAKDKVEAGLLAPEELCTLWDRYIACCQAYAKILRGQMEEQQDDRNELMGVGVQ